MRVYVGRARGRGVVDGSGRAALRLAVRGALGAVEGETMLVAVGGVGVSVSE